MLQFITNPSDRWSIAEEVRMAIEGGCRWIQLRMKDASDEEVRRTAMELIPLCRDHDTFLIIDDRVELVNELRVSGVHLGRGDMDPMEARELLGPHAIIGVTANTAEDIIKWKGKDVDYVASAPYTPPRLKKISPRSLGTEGVKEVVDTVRKAGVELPIVAIGGLTLDDVDPLKAAGINGIAVSGAIINAPDPMLYTMKIMERLMDIPHD